MATFAGIDLVQPTPELAAWVERNVSLGDVVEFRRAPRLHFLSYNLVWEDTRADQNTNCRPIKLGSLWWPSGASRWACAHFLATESQLAAIRSAIGTGTGTLTMDDGFGGTISTDLYLLPPRPLTQNPPDAAHFSTWTLPCPDFASPGEPCYLISLVDERYHWQDERPLTRDVFDPFHWQNLFTVIQADLGLNSLIVGDIAGAYSHAIPLDLLDEIGTERRLPWFLDFAAAMIGHRVVRDLDGTVRTQSAAAALASAQSQVNTYKDRLAGGQFAFDVDTTHTLTDLSLILPARVNVVFTDKTVTEVALKGLALEFSDIATRDAAKTLTVPYPAPEPPGDPGELAAQIAADWYAWQACKLDMVFPGIAPWEPEGGHDVEWVHTGLANAGDDKGSTRVQRAEWDTFGDMVQDTHGELCPVRMARVVTTVLEDYTRVGNNITGTGFDPLPVIDGVTLVLNDPLLVNLPGGSADNGLWYVRRVGGTDPDWVTHTAYFDGDIVNDNGLAYTATQDHTSLPETEPGAGVDWTQFWDPVAGAAEPFILERTPDADTSAKMRSGMVVEVTEGDLNKGTTWKLTTLDPVVLNTTVLKFAEPTTRWARVTDTLPNGYQTISFVSVDMDGVIVSVVFDDVDAGLAFLAGDPLQMTGFNDINNSRVSMVGTVTSYSGTTLTVNISSHTGTGTGSTWTIGCTLQLGQIHGMYPAVLLDNAFADLGFVWVVDGNSLQLGAGLRYKALRKLTPAADGNPIFATEKSWVGVSQYHKKIDPADTSFYDALGFPVTRLDFEESIPVIDPGNPYYDPHPWGLQVVRSGEAALVSIVQGDTKLTVTGFDDTYPDNLAVTVPYVEAISFSTVFILTPGGNSVGVEIQDAAPTQDGKVNHGGQTFGGAKAFFPSGWTSGSFSGTTIAQSTVTLYDVLYDPLGPSYTTTAESTLTPVRYTSGNDLYSVSLTGASFAMAIASGPKGFTVTTGDSLILASGTDTFTLSNGAQSLVAYHSDTYQVQMSPTLLMMTDAADRATSLNVTTATITANLDTDHTTTIKYDNLHLVNAPPNDFTISVPTAAIDAVITATHLMQAKPEALMLKVTTDNYISLTTSSANAHGNISSYVFWNLLPQSFTMGLSLTNTFAINTGNASINALASSTKQFQLMPENLYMQMDANASMTITTASAALVGIVDGTHSIHLSPVYLGTIAGAANATFTTATALANMSDGTNSWEMAPSHLTMTLGPTVVSIDTNALQVSATDGTNNWTMNVNVGGWGIAFGNAAGNGQITSLGCLLTLECGGGGLSASVQIRDTGIELLSGTPWPVVIISGFAGKYMNTDGVDPVSGFPSGFLINEVDGATFAGGIFTGTGWTEPGDPGPTALCFPSVLTPGTTVNWSTAPITILNTFASNLATALLAALQGLGGATTAGGIS